MRFPRSFEAHQLSHFASEQVCRSSFDEVWGPTEHQAMADVNNNAGVVVGSGFDAATAR